MNQGLFSVLKQCGLFFCVWIAITPPVFAHEFWIEPVSYQVPTGDNVVAWLRNGEEFAGSNQPYVKNNTIRFEFVSGEEVVPVGARLGDNPAVNVPAQAHGLAVVVHQKKVTTLRYSTWEKFQRFADHKAFADIRQRHQARGLPESGFKEAYSRYSKALVAVGNGTGSDRQVNLEVELVALANPYTDDMSNGLKVAAYYQGRRVSHTQIELFEKDQAGEVIVSLHKTDEQGEVLLPVRPSHSYLVDMVVLREPAEALVAQYKVVWETLWASLTFAVP